ncbi:SCO4848 family membrane protein [Arthrobacter sp. A5]|uniref:SCO4848 family membrane protein n=1 Tax=Arthrobacter sp. A5 TaxID=576926 RepID=UPI003DA8FA7F
MQLPIPLSIVLILAGLWSLIVWPQFMRRVLKDPKARDEAGKATRFLTVHLMLVSTSMVLGLATAVIGIRALVS